MAVTITELRTPINECDATTGWSLSNLSSQSIFSSDPAPIEPSGCLGIQVNNENGYVYRTVSYDLSDTLVYVWARPYGTMNTFANVGVGIVLGDGTNTIAFAVGGSDVAGFKHGVGPHEWTCYLLDTTSLPSTEIVTIAGSAASLSLGSITLFGVYFYTLAKALGGTENCFLDIMRYGAQGIQVTGGGSGTEGSFDDIATAERTSTEDGAYAACRELATTVYGVQAAVTFGDATSASTDFESNGETVVFEPPYNGIANDRFWLLVQGNATGTTSVVWSGCTFICPAGIGAELDATDADVDTFTMAGCNVNGFEQGIAFLAATTTNTHSVTGCTFDGCGQVVPGWLLQDGTFTGNTISNSTASATGALLLASTGYTSGLDLTDTTFISGGTGHAIYITQAGTYDFTDLLFSGYGANDTTNAAVYNNSGGAVTINASGCTGLTVRNGTSASTTVNQNVTVTLTNLVTNTEVRVYDDGTTTEVDGIENVTTGSWSFSYGAGEVVDIRVFAVSYEPADILGYTIPSVATSIPVQQRYDRNYENP